MLAFNVSNRYLALEPVLGNLARDAGLACAAQMDRKSEDNRGARDRLIGLGGDGQAQQGSTGCDVRRGLARLRARGRRRRVDR